MKFEGVQKARFKSTFIHECYKVSQS